MITRQFGIPVTSPGAILRREKDLGTPLGQETAEVLQLGGLVSDKIIVGLIEDWLRLHGGHGFGLKYLNRLCVTVLQAVSNAANAGSPPALRARNSRNVPSVRIAMGR